MVHIRAVHFNESPNHFHTAVVGKADQCVPSVDHDRLKLSLSNTPPPHGHATLLHFDSMHTSVPTRTVNMGFTLA